MIKSRGRRLALAASLFFLAFPSASKAEEASTDCFKESRVQKELAKDFKLDWASSTYAHCNSQNAPFSMAKTLLFLKDLPSFKKSKNGFGQPTLGSSPYSYLKKNVKKFSFRPDDDPECLDGSLVFTSSDDKETLFFCEKTANYREFYVAAAILHQSRHLKGKKHVACVRVGASDCDESFESGGGLSVETEFYLGLSELKETDEDIREVVRQDAFNKLRTRFNTLHKDLKEGAVFVTATENKLYFFDGKKAVPLTSEKPNGIPVFNGTSVAFLEAAEGYQQIVGVDGILDEDTLKDPFLHSLPEDQKKLLVDRYFINEQVCYLLPNSVSCSDPADSKTFASLTFPEAAEKGLRFVRFNYAREDKDPSRLFVATESGGFYEVPNDWESMKAGLPLERVTQPYPFGLRGIVALGERETLLLTTHGVVVTKSEGKAPAYKVSPLSSYGPMKMIAPYVWSEKFRPKP